MVQRSREVIWPLLRRHTFSSSAAPPGSRRPPSRRALLRHVVLREHRVDGDEFVGGDLVLSPDVAAVTFATVSLILKWVCPM